MKKLACPNRRRPFLTLTAVATAAYSLPRRLLAATAESPVNAFRSAAATAKITTHKLRGNVSMVHRNEWLAVPALCGLQLAPALAGLAARSCRAGVPAAPAHRPLAPEPT